MDTAYTKPVLAAADQSADASMEDALLRYVDENCYDPALCLNSVASFMNASIYTVSRIFKETTGVGFKEYVKSARLMQAKQLLEVSNKTISQVAAESGFDNATYFTTLFKNKFGLPPSQYRQNFQKK